MAAVLKLLQVALVNICAVTLQIRAEISADMRTFVPIEAEPLQTLVNRCGGFFSVASPVGVLDAQNEFAAVMPGEEPIEQCGARAADMQIARGGRGETDTGFGIH